MFVGRIVSLQIFRWRVSVTPVGMEFPSVIYKVGLFIEQSTKKQLSFLSVNEQESKRGYAGWKPLFLQPNHKKCHPYLSAAFHSLAVNQQIHPTL